MSGKPTSFDIAALAGVSQPTVSRALRGSPSVSERTRLRVEAIARQLNYKVDKNASNLRRQHADTLALLFFEDETTDDSHINPFFLAMLGSITRACAERGFDLLISFQQLSGNWHVDYEDSRKADGIILLGYGDYLAFEPQLQRLIEQQTRFVRWGSVEEGMLGTTIGCDNVQGGCAATGHLLARGCRRIAFIGTATHHYPEFHARWTGYVAAHAAVGMVPDPALCHDAQTIQMDGYRAMQAILDRAGDVDGLFAASDLIAIGAMRAIAEAGRVIPDDIAVVGFDDLPAASFTLPALTTVNQDVRLAGTALVDALLAQINGAAAPSRTLPTRLVIRGTA